jgi:hypothetical protein
MTAHTTGFDTVAEDNSHIYEALRMQAEEVCAFIDLDDSWIWPTEAEIEEDIERSTLAHANFVGPRQPLHFVSDDFATPF